MEESLAVGEEESFTEMVQVNWREVSWGIVNQCLYFAGRRRVQ